MYPIYPTVCMLSVGDDNDRLGASVYVAHGIQLHLLSPSVVVLNDAKPIHPKVLHPEELCKVSGVEDCARHHGRVAPESAGSLQGIQVLLQSARRWLISPGNAPDIAQSEVFHAGEGRHKAEMLNVNQPGWWWSLD